MQLAMNVTYVLLLLLLAISFDQSLGLHDGESTNLKNDITTGVSVNVDRNLNVSTVLYPKRRRIRKKGKFRKIRRRKLINGSTVSTSNTTEPSVQRKMIRRKKLKKLVKIPGIIPLKTNLYKNHKYTPMNVKKYFLNQTIIITTMNPVSYLIEKNRNTKKPSGPCERNNGGCSQNCHWTNNITTCSCLKGFYLKKDQKSCEDINECETNNGNCSSICINTLGFYSCSCPIGYRLGDDRRSCEDLNECSLRNGHGLCQDKCTNTLGSYSCSCEDLKGTKLNSDGRSCDDINECALNNGGCSHLCINAFGRAFCSCPGGFLLSSDWRTCQDINECETEKCDGVCLNTEGSYKCLTNRELQLDQFPNVTCRPLFPPSKGYISCSKMKGKRKVAVNNPGTSCKLICPPGFKLKGRYQVICGPNGEWEGLKTARCVRKKRRLLLL